LDGGGERCARPPRLDVHLTVEIPRSGQDHVMRDDRSDSSLIRLSADTGVESASYKDLTGLEAAKPQPYVFEHEKIADDDFFYLEVI
jgi:hypothetical protein